MVDVNPASMASESAALGTAALNVQSATVSLGSALSACSGMAGIDPMAEEFANGTKEEGGYDQSMASMLKAGTTLSQSLAGFEGQILGLAAGYRAMEIAGTESGTNPYASMTPTTVSATPPGWQTSLGDEQLGTPLGDVMEWIENFLKDTAGIVIPTANTGKVSTAASAWDGYSGEIRSAKSSVAAALPATLAMTFPQRDSVSAVQTKMETLLSGLADDADSLSAFCNDYVTNVEAIRAELLSMLGQLALEVAIDIGVGLILSSFTFGAGALAGIGKATATILKWVPRIENVLMRLKTLIMSAKRTMAIMRRAAIEAIESAVSGTVANAGASIAFGNFSWDGLAGASISSLIGGGISGPFSHIGSNIVRRGPRITVRASIDGVTGGAGGVAGEWVASQVTGQDFNLLMSAIAGTAGGTAAGGITSIRNPPNLNITPPSTGGGPSTTTTPTAPSTGNSGAPPSGNDVPTVSGAGNGGSSSTGGGGGVDIPSNGGPGGGTPGGGSGGQASGGGGADVPGGDVTVPGSLDGGGHGGGDGGETTTPANDVTPPPANEHPTPPPAGDESPTPPPAGDENPTPPPGNETNDPGSTETSPQNDGPSQSGDEPPAQSNDENNAGANSNDERGGPVPPAGPGQGGSTTPTPPEGPTVKGDDGDQPAPVDSDDSNRGPEESDQSGSDDQSSADDEASNDPGDQSDGSDRNDGADQGEGGSTQEQSDVAPAEGGPQTPEPKTGTRVTEGSTSDPYVRRTPPLETIPAKDAPNRYSQDDVQQALDSAPRNENGDPVDHRNGRPLDLENSAGNRGWEMRWDPENNTWVAENRGSGNSDLPLKGEPGSYGYDENGDLLPYADHRPAYDAGQVERVWNNSRQNQLDLIAEGELDLPTPGPDQMWVRAHPDADPSGLHADSEGEMWRLIEWRPEEGRQGVWDMGHTSDARYRDLKEDYMSGRIDEETFLERYRNPDNYEVQDPSRNRSRIDD